MREWLGALRVGGLVVVWVAVMLSGCLLAADYTGPIYNTISRTSNQSGNSLGLKFVPRREVRLSVFQRSINTHCSNSMG